MKIKYSLYTLFLFLSFINLSSQTSRVVGYLPTYRFYLNEQIDYCKLTHLNICFANPDSLGNLEIENIEQIISTAKNKNPHISIFVSLAGGALTAEQSKIWSNYIDLPENRPILINSIVSFLGKNNLDGVDIDLEWDNVTAGYSDFILELKTSLINNFKTLSAAFPNNLKYENVSNEAINAFDFINIMSYDATGPWQPATVGQHSSLEFAILGINYWKNTVGVSSDRINLGLPFYGYDFVDGNTVNALTYNQIVNLDTNNSYYDQVGNLYYNGRPTIRAKIDLANSEVGGVFVWEIGQDSFGELSLLSTIHNHFTNKDITTTSLCGNEVTLLSVEDFAKKNLINKKFFQIQL